MPNALMEPIHDRMPVILPPETWAAWLGEATAEPDALRALLSPCPPERLTCWTIGPAVGNVKNDGPALIEPVVGSA